MAKVGGGSIGNGVIGDGEGGWCWGGGRLVVKCALLEGGDGVEG